jgi:hypothetical protein
MTSILTDIINDNMYMFTFEYGRFSENTYLKKKKKKKPHYTAKLMFIIDAIPFEKPMDIHTYHQY